MDWYDSGSRPGKPKSRNPRRRQISKKDEKIDPDKNASEEEEEELELSVGKDKLMSVESSPRTMENNPGDDTESGKLVVLVVIVIAIVVGGILVQVDVVDDVDVDVDADNDVDVDISSNIFS